MAGYSYKPLCIGAWAVASNTNDIAVLRTIAAHRFGLGEMNPEAVVSEPLPWLRQQMTASKVLQSQPSTAEVAAELAVIKLRENKLAKGQSLSEADRRYPVQVYGAYVKASLENAIVGAAPFQQRMLDFYSNHFSVTASNKRVRALAGCMERDAIAPHLFGNFADMLIAVTQHPAMLLYLNNASSFGDNSRLGKRKSKGLNENLAREILELHTLGVEGGYTQEDVIELAKAISGWTTPGLRERSPDAHTFRFRTEGHEPGSRTLMGTRYADNGVQQGVAMLQDLAVHPSTARFVSFKLARHLVADEPPQTLVQAMTDTWLSSGGNLKLVVETLLEHDLAWDRRQQKFKTAREFVISAFRVLGRRNLKERDALSRLTIMGQRPFGAGSPAGYGDEAEDWNGAEAILARADWSAQLANRSRKDPVSWSQLSLGPLLSERTQRMIAGAESAERGRALFLMSPEFLQR